MQKGRITLWGQISSWRVLHKKMTNQTVQGLSGKASTHCQCAGIFSGTSEHPALCSWPLSVTFFPCLRGFISHYPLHHRERLQAEPAQTQGLLRSSRHPPMPGEPQSWITTVLNFPCRNHLPKYCTLPLSLSLLASVLGGHSQIRIFDQL